MNWSALIFIVAAALLVWVAITMIKRNPNLFSKENMGKSIYTLGLLTLMIIAIIAFCVMALRG